MLGKIEEIIDNSVKINLEIDITKQPNLVNLHIIFDDGSNKKVVAEIANVNRKIMYANIVGEIVNGVFIPGSSTKPSFRSSIRIINAEELELIFGKQNTSLGYTNFGTSNVYEGYKINVALNEFFNCHFAVLGNSGAGKSCTIASILQKLYTSNDNPPLDSSLFFFDAYGEYTNAFSGIHEKNPLLNYKIYTTNIVNPIKRKNDIIARAIQDILLSGAESTKIRDQVIGVLTKFNTPTLSLETQIVQPGYTRTLKQCLYIDKMGKMQEMELVVEFIRGYIIEGSNEYDENIDEEVNLYYTINDLEQAMDFALINEGILKSNKVFDNANVMSVRLHSLATGDNKYYFTYPKYITRDQFIESLVWNPATNSKAQIINFNINYVDDRIAKVITKIISRMLFIKSSSERKRGSRAYHIIIEEAHRYVQHDNDINIIGYNIFERIAKEGRKYGIFLVLITQRPSELSDTCVSQCANFIILRTLHPTDLAYIKEMVPNISSEIVLQLKNLKPGNCIAFGSAFKVPTSIYVDLPNPQPLSNNVDLENVWFQTNRMIKESNSHQADNNNVSNLMNQMANPNSEVITNQPSITNNVETLLD